MEKKEKIFPKNKHSCSTVYTGNGEPPPCLGHNGDFYIDNENGEYYQKICCHWKKRGKFGGDVDVQEELCKIFDAASMTEIEETDFILIKDDITCSFKKFTLKQAAMELKQICLNMGPKPINCEATEKSFGLRYRNFSSGGANEIYLGIGALGVPANRSEAAYVWNSVQYRGEFEFWYDSTTGKINQRLISIFGQPSSVSLNFPQALTLRQFLLNLNDIFTVEELDAIEIIVSNRDTNNGNNPNNMVTLRDLDLTTNTGIVYPILYQGSHFFSPFPAGNTSQIIAKYSWPSDGTIPADGFRFRGTVEIRGTFSASQESAKVEINIFGCEV